MTKAGCEYEDLVAYVVRAMDPNAEVKTRDWIQGPDGVRDMDVFIRGNVEGVERKVVIECKDYDRKKTGKIGIKEVDALDSKRADLGVDFAVICSNSGFSGDAIRKAKRKRIGLVSVLKEGDARVKVEIIEEIYFRKVWFGGVTVTYRILEGQQIPKPEAVKPHDVSYQDLPIINWAQIRASAIAAANPHITGTISAPHSFRGPVGLQFATRVLLVDGIDLRFTPKVKWYAQTVILDASLGMYDYLRGRVRLIGRESRYIVKGVNFDSGKLINFIPPTKDLSQGLLSGEVDLNLVMIEDLDFGGIEQGPKIDDLIRPEDLWLEVNANES